MNYTIILLLALFVFQGVQYIPNNHQEGTDLKQRTEPKRIVIRLVNATYSSTLPSSEEIEFNSIKNEYASKKVLFYDLKWNIVDDIKKFFIANNINLQVKQSGPEATIYNSKVNMVADFKNAILILEESGSVWFCTSGDCGKRFIEGRLKQ